MKLSKKILAAFSAATLLAVAGTFVSCTEDDDDTEHAISGSGKNYTVSYTNKGTEIYRATNTTTFKHEGELVKITLNNQTPSSKDGNMGFIWDLKQSKDAKACDGTTAAAVTEKGFQNFFVFGFQNDGSEGSGKGPRYYVSKLFNVSDIQGDNFGATGTDYKVTTHDAGVAATTPKELEVKTWTQLSGLNIAADKTLTIWVDIYPVFKKSTTATENDSTYGVNKIAHVSDAEGTYIVDIYSKDPNAEGTTASDILDTVIIAPNVTGYSAEPKQGTLAVYCNVQPSKTLDGAWNLAQDYAAAEAVEE